MTLGRYLLSFFLCQFVYFRGLTPMNLKDDTTNNHERGKDMNDYILLMHNDSGNTNSDDWNLYVTKLNQLGCFDGGSSIGGGKCISKKPQTKAITEFLA